MEAKAAANTTQANQEKKIHNHNEVALEDYDEILRAENVDETADQSSAENEQRKENEGFSQVKINKLCKNWTRNKCRKGSLCKFKHPDLCKIFAKFGPQQKSNPRGCDNKCDLLHPRDKWCFQAVKTGMCRFGKECKYSHFKGVKQNMESQKENPRKSGTSYFKSDQGKHRMNNTPRPIVQNCQQRSYASVAQNNQDPFLDKVGLGSMIMDLMSRMDKMDQWMRSHPWQAKSPWQH